MFVTSIRNVMAENRFNDFLFDDDWIVSFEPLAFAVEDQVLPTYKKILRDAALRQLTAKKAALAFLIAFQRDVQVWEDWQPATENSLKRDHLLSIRKSIGEFAQIIATKDFLLAAPADGRSFYLRNNPVCLNNMLKFGPRGNLGLAVTDIEIYMPLASDLLLCAWCPSILSTLRSDYENVVRERRSEAVGQVMAGTMTAQEMKDSMEQFCATDRPVASLLSAAAESRPVSSNKENMEYYNSLQASLASRYMVCQQADFSLAQRFCRENPDARRGYRIGAA